MESQKRERSANFITAEVLLLVSLVTKHKYIVENKKTDAVTNKLKQNAWKNIERSFNSCGITSSFRSWKTLKLKYEGLKKSTKKKSLQTQQMYKTVGEPPNASDFDEIEEKVLSICSNIKGLEARYDSDTTDNSDTVLLPIPANEDNAWEFCSTDIQEQREAENNNTQAHIEIPVTDDPQIQKIKTGEPEDDNIDNSQTEKKWHPKALGTEVLNILKNDVAPKASVTSKLDKLRAAQLELVQLQMEVARKQHQFAEEEHKLKMLHLKNDEKRKEEIHALLKLKIKSKTSF